MICFNFFKSICTGQIQNAKMRSCFVASPNLFSGFIRIYGRCKMSSATKYEKKKGAEVMGDIHTTMDISLWPFALLRYYRGT